MVKRYILDSGIVTDWMNHRNGVDQRVAAAYKDGARVGIGTPVLGELLGGLENSSSRNKNEPKLERVLARMTLWTFDEKASREYGKIAGNLRSRGITIQQVDMQIAAIAFALSNCVVVTTDSDFNDVTGLSVENWAAP